MKPFKPEGAYYTISPNEINDIVMDFVEKTIGMRLTLNVGHFNEHDGNPYDVYVEWLDTDEKIQETMNVLIEKQLPFWIHPEEIFLSRDSIFQSMFDNPYTTCLYDEHLETYIIHAPILSFNDKLKYELKRIMARRRQRVKI